MYVYRTNNILHRGDYESPKGHFDTKSLIYSKSSCGNRRFHETLQRQSLVWMDGDVLVVKILWCYKCLRILPRFWEGLHKNSSQLQKGAWSLQKLEPKKQWFIHITFVSFSFVIGRNSVMQFRGFFFHSRSNPWFFSEWFARIYETIEFFLF